MILTVYPQSFDSQSQELLTLEPKLVAGIDKGTLRVEGEMPYQLEGTTTLEEISTLTGQEAVDMLMLMASLKYGSYSKVVYEGFTSEQVLDFISGLPKRDQMKIRSGERLG